MSVFNALDNIDGGAGNDTLALTISGDATPLKGALAGIETVNVVATGSIGTFETLPAQAQKQVRSFTLGDRVSGTSATYAATDKITVTVGNVSTLVDLTGVSTAAGAATAIAKTIEGILDAAYGTDTDTDGSGSTDTDTAVWASATSGVVTVTAQTAGVALPTISIAGVKVDNTALSYKFTAATVQANVEASGYVEASVFAAGAVVGATTFNAEAGSDVNASAASTTDVNITSGGKTTLAGGKNVTIDSYDAVKATGLKGAVVVTVSDEAGAASTIEGGTTVSYSQVGGYASLGQQVYASEVGVSIGAAPTVAALPSSTVGQTYISNTSKSPTGNVTVDISKSFSTLTGKAAMIYGTGAVTVNTNGGDTVSVKGGSTATITDIQTALTQATATSTAVAGTSKLATVVLDGVAGASTIKSDALTALTVVNSGYDNGAGARTASTVTVTNAATGGHALTLTVGNNAAGTSVTDATATSLTVNSAAQAISTTSASAMALNVAAATGITFNTAHAFTLASSTTTALTKITANNSATLNLGEIGGANKLTAVDGSGASGSIVATVDKTIGLGSAGALSAADHSLTITGGSGADAITVKGAMASATNPVTAAVVQNVISLGAGNDVVKNNWNTSAYTGSIGAGAVVSGGEGTDIIASSLLNSGNAAQITGFEVLGLDQRSSSTVYDVRLLSGATGLAMLDRGGSYSNVATSQSLSIVEGTTATYSSGSIDPSTDVTTLGFGSAVAAGTADTYAVVFNTSAPTSTAIARVDADAGVLAIEGIESVSVTSNGTGFINNHVRLVDASARTLTLSGSQNLYATFGATAGNDDDSNTTSVDEVHFGTVGTSTDSNGVSVIDASTMTGKLYLDTTDVGVAYAGLTVKGGSAADTVLLAGKATVDLGAGDDVLTSSSAGGKFTLGAGLDTVNAAAAMAGSGKASSITITDPSTGDKIDFRVSDGTLGATTAAVGLAVTGTFTNLTDALDAAANATGSIAWLQWGGKTYVVYDADGSTSGGVASTGDVVVTLDGAFDLSKATFNVDSGVLTFA